MPDSHKLGYLFIRTISRIGHNSIIFYIILSFFIFRYRYKYLLWNIIIIGFLNLLSLFSQVSTKDASFVFPSSVSDSMFTVSCKVLPGFQTLQKHQQPQQVYDMSRCMREAMSKNVLLQWNPASTQIPLLLLHFLSLLKSPATRILYYANSLQFSLITTLFFLLKLTPLQC